MRDAFTIIRTLEAMNFAVETAQVEQRVAVHSINRQLQQDEPGESSGTIAGLEDSNCWLKGTSSRH